jgi:hypothetical protein
MPSSTLSYLQYLRDISRKIVDRTDFDKIFITDTKARPTFRQQLFNFDHKISQANTIYPYLEQINAFLDRNLDCKLFIGFGLVAGTHKRKRIAAPILFAEVAVEFLKEINVFQWEIDLNTLTLNYDLLTSLTGSLQNEEGAQWNSELEAELNLIEHFEKEIDYLFEDGKCDTTKIIDFSQKHFKQPFLKALHLNQTLYDFLSQYAQLIFIRCKALLPAFREIPQYELSYRLQDQIELYQLKSQPKKRLRPSIFEQNPVFVPAVHTFVNKIPGQLSTYEALSTLYHKISKSSEDFDNQLLNGMLHNVLSLQVENLRELAVPDCAAIDAAFIHKWIPLSLNLSQKKAIQFAWNAPISYVQGPPGSGKSHTIVAVLLSALVLGKSVLVTSQKEAALEVVKEKLEPLLTNPLFSENLLYFNKEAKKNLRSYYKKLIQLSQDKTALLTQIENILNELKKAEERLEEVFQRSLSLEKENAETLSQIHYYAVQQEIFNEQKKNLIEKFRIPDTQNVQPVPLLNIARTKFLTDRFIALEKQGVKNILLSFHKQRFKKALIEKLGAQKALLDQYFIEYAKSWVGLSVQYTETLSAAAAIKTDPTHQRFDLARLREETRAAQTQVLRLLQQLKVLQALQQKSFVTELIKLEKMLYWNKPSLIAEKMQEIDFARLLEGFPLWACDIRNLSQAFPINANLFDLVVVDEASQVNLAEILPALYRGKRFCIVGDHLQLSLHSTGLNFQLSNKFDSYCWHKYKPAGLNYEEANLHALTVTQSSILDFIRSEANYFSVPTVLLNEHYRSMPALAQFTARFYKQEEDGIKVMTETPEKLSQYSFQAICVGGLRDENRRHPKEAQEVLRVVQYLLQNTSYSIGIISFLRSQCAWVEEVLLNEITEENWQKCGLIIGTPEELQGHERDVIILTPALDASCRHSAGHYQNPKRFNVATSRAKIFTYFIYGGLPDNFELFHQYLRHFEAIQSSPVLPGWKDKPLPTQVQLYFFITDILAYFCRNYNLQLLYDGGSCGYQGLDWLIYNSENSRCVLIFLEGIDLLSPKEYKVGYANSYIAKIETLERAGWKIYALPYPKGYYKGNLLIPQSQEFTTWVENIYDALLQLLRE